MPRGDVATSGDTPRREQRRPWLEETCGLSPVRELVGRSRLVSRPTANASLLTASDFRQCVAESMPARGASPISANVRTTNFLPMGGVSERIFPRAGPGRRQPPGGGAG